jgi:hypothetical protein
MHAKKKLIVIEWEQSPLRERSFAREKITILTELQKIEPERRIMPTD